MNALQICLSLGLLLILGVVCWLDYINVDMSPTL